MNPLKQLHEHGQSLWLDNLDRDMISSGELEGRIREEGLRGITSNPKIFDKAISKGEAYDDDIERFVRQGLAPDAIYEKLAISDIRDACDVLRPIFDESRGRDGFVSLEVSPYLVHDTEATMAEARRLFGEVDRPNVLIKIPGSPAGVPAIEQMLAEGVNINITLLFSISAYEAVAEAYLRALERRAADGQDLASVASVASFFLSRIDVLTDRLLGQRIRARVVEGSEPRPEQLLGRAATANAKLAYRSFRRLFSGDRWDALERQGARVQRVLWASTSTKNPLYSDVRYVEPLIGNDTVNTMPDRTIAAFSDHGLVRPATVEEDVEDAERVMADLAAVGIDFECVTSQLLDEGMQKFVDPYDDLMTTLADRRGQILGAHARPPRLSKSGSDVSAATDALSERLFARRLDARDPTLWTADPEEATAVANRLGWLDSASDFTERVGDLESFAQTVRDDGIRWVVLLGMGGSSLCPEVSSEIFGSAQGFPRLVVLDSTDPAAVRRVEETVEIDRTLFIVASKSGTTTETLSFLRHFWEAVESPGIAEPGQRFVAITDPGSPLADEADDRGFRRTFLNPEDIGGRYSALSYFGLVPMALLGMDLGRLLARARGQRASCGPAVPATANSGLLLGAALGANGRDGRDKVTLILDSPIAAFGAWLEQLLAESTGKNGRGLLPVTGEPLGEPDVYGPDRIFVSLELAGVDDSERAERLEALEDAGHPVVRIALDDIYDLGAEFVRWEIATATAGAVLGVNPFDEPNVTESKKNTRELLDRWQEKGKLDEAEPTARGDELRAWHPGGDGMKDDPRDVLRGLLDELSTGDYLAILAYLEETDERNDVLERLRRAIRDRRTVATTVGYGPRYLHSTGQLHKGGPDTGVYLVLTAGNSGDAPIPGRDFGFATLLRAQALGDFRALAEHGRRVVRVDLGDDADRGLKRLLDELS